MNWKKLIKININGLNTPIEDRDSKVESKVKVYVVHKKHALNIKSR